MSAIVIILPIIPLDPLAEEELHEQQIREQGALIRNLTQRPVRSWPILVVDNAGTLRGLNDQRGPH